MKKFRHSMFLFIALFIGTACAGEYEDARQEAYNEAMIISAIKKNESTCAVIGRLVTRIMVSRMNGEAMSAQMKLPDFTFYKYVIKDAYSQPSYQTNAAKEQLLREFREKYELECYAVTGSTE